MLRSPRTDPSDACSLLQSLANKPRSLPPMASTWWHFSAPDLPWLTFLKRSRSRSRLIYSNRAMLLSVLLLLLYCSLSSVTQLCEALPAMQLHGSSSSSSSRILIWPDQIEDNALTKQNGEFVYKQATAAEKQEQKSSSSIFFWPSSHGGNHHHRPSRNHSPSLHLSIYSLLLVVASLTVQWTLCRFVR